VICGKTADWFWMPFAMELQDMKMQDMLNFRNSQILLANGSGGPQCPILSKFVNSVRTTNEGHFITVQNLVAIDAVVSKA